MKKNILSVIILAVLLLVGFYGYWNSRSAGIRTVTIGGIKVRVTTVSNPSDLARGLSGVARLDPDQGMLFLFPTKGFYQFWMKDMLIPLDIIWLRDNSVADITRDVPPPADLSKQENLPLYSSREAIDSVLEVPAGFADQHGLRIGDSVIFGK